MSQLEAQLTSRRLSIIGAGKFGTTIARAAVAAGYDVVLARSGPPEDIALMIEILVPGARAVTLAEAIAHSDLIVLAVPSHRFRELPPHAFTGKVLVDPINPTEGVSVAAVNSCPCVSRNWNVSPPNAVSPRM